MTNEPDIDIEVNRKVEILKRAIQGLEEQKFLNQMDEKFFQYLYVADTKVAQALAMVQSNLKLVTAKLVYFKGKLKEYEAEAGNDSASR